VEPVQGSRLGDHDHDEYNHANDDPNHEHDDLGHDPDDVCRHVVNPDGGDHHNDRRRGESRTVVCAGVALDAGPARRLRRPTLGNVR
jgi:hypothetical protein